MINREIPLSFILYHTSILKMLLMGLFSFEIFLWSARCFFFKKTLLWHFFFFSKYWASLTLTIWLVKQIVVSKVTTARVLHDPVNTSAALICNGSHSVRLVSVVGGCALGTASKCVYAFVFICVSSDCAQIIQVWGLCPWNAHRSRAHLSTVCWCLSAQRKAK